MNKHLLISVTVVTILIIIGILIGLTRAPSMENRTARNGDHVYVNYDGRLANGQKFDSSYDRHVPIDFILGTGAVIRGWDKGLVGMKEGERKVLTISPEDAYGDQDVTDSAGSVIIPANETLTFEVQMVKIVR